MLNKLKHIISILLILSLSIAQLGLIIHTHCCPSSEVASDNSIEDDCCEEKLDYTTEYCCATNTSQTAENTNCEEHCLGTCYIGSDYIKLDIDQIVKQKEEFKEYFLLLAKLKSFNQNSKEFLKRNTHNYNAFLPHLYGKALIVFLNKEKIPDILTV